MKVKIQQGGYLVNGVKFVPKAEGNRDYALVKVWLKSNTPDPEFTDVELLDNAKIKIVTMRQARLALLEKGLLTTVTDAINGSTDEALKIEWGYAHEVKREWGSLIVLTESIGITSQDLDDLFLLAGTL